MVATDGSDRGGEGCQSTMKIMASPTSVVTAVPTVDDVLDKKDPAVAIDMEPMTLPPASHSYSCGASWPNLPASRKSQRTTNPIRSIVDPIFSSIKSGSERGDGKDPISLALGDPTAAGNLPPCPAAIEAVQHALSNASCAAGYVPATGLPSAREAIAKYHSTTNLYISSDHVVVASGCSGALELALTALLDENSILLVPQPGFPLYQVICESHGARTLEYRLDPDERWQVDLDHLEQLLSESAPLPSSSPTGTKTTTAIRGVVLNNPSNPTGAVYSRAHLQDVVRLCQRYHVPIVSDEVYGNLTYFGHEFVSVAQVAGEMGSQVPVIIASGMGKQFLLPGWRVGWVVFCDNAHGSLRAVEAGAKRLAQVVLGASHLAQVAVPALLDASNIHVRDWTSRLCRTLEDQAKLVTRALSDAPGLHLCPPAGAMYIMIKLDLDRFPDVAGDVEFSSLLLQQENVVLLPGTCFGAPGYVRIVYCAPQAVLEEAAARMKAFCSRHFK